MATVTVRIPTPLRSFTGGTDQVRVQGNTVGEIIQALGETHNGLADRILNAEGKPRNFVNIFIGERNIRALDDLATPVAEGDVLSIVPAVAGGIPI